MKVLHLPVEIAGQAYLSVQGLRDAGVTATFLAPPHPFNYPVDRIVGRSKNRFIRLLERLYATFEVTGAFDLYHYHFGQSLLPAKIDTWLNRALRKPMVIEFWGSDIRSPSVETQRNPYYPGAQHYGESDNRSEKLLRSWARLTGGVAVVSDHLFNAQLQAHFPTIYIVGQRCDIASVIPTYPSVDARRPRIVHAPSHRAVKGTEHLERALERLRTLGLHFDYIRIENMSHDEATTAYRSADLIVDQLCLGAHGIFACEAMALGKPVICYTLDEAAAGYPSGLPLINANPDTIERVLEQWLADGAARHAAGVRSRAYAERVHDYLLVGRRLAAIYCNHLANTHPKGINDWRERNFTDSNSNR